MVTVPHFYPGQQLIWSSREGGSIGGGDGVLINRPVQFIDFVDTTNARVSSGLDYEGHPKILQVPASELTIPTPPETPEQFRIPPVPPPPRLRTPEQLAELIEERHEALRREIAERDRAEEAVKAAEELVRRADSAVRDAERDLAKFGDLEQLAADTVLHRIRGKKENGHSPLEIDHEWAAAERSRRVRDAAKRARDQVIAGLDHAKEDADRRARVVKGTALAIIALEAERRGCHLEELEREAAGHRAELTALAEWWPDASGPFRITPELASLLAAKAALHSDFFAVPGRSALHESNAASWRELFVLLISDKERDI